MTRLLSARLLNRLGEAHAVDPRIGLELKDVDRFSVKDKGYTFRKSQTLVVTATPKSFGLKNTEKKIGIYHGTFMDALSAGQKISRGGPMSVRPITWTVMDWLEEQELSRDHWRDYGGEG